MKLAIQKSDESSQGKPTRIVIVGLGGTGGYVFYHLARLIAALPDRENFQIVLADGDITEEKNLTRQNFAAEDIGRFKVECLAERYGNVYNMNLPCFVRYVEDETSLYRLLRGEILNFNPSLSIMVGCVDNNATRQLMDKAFREWEIPLVYIDSGNDEWSGQVILGARGSKAIILPPVGDYYPDILADQDTLFPSEESCTQRAVSSPQNIATNVLAGTLVFTLLNQLLAGGGVTTCGATFNARTGQTRALYLDEILKEKGEIYPFEWF